MALVITVPVKCPVCKKMKKPCELKEIQNSYNDGDETIYGHALITNCCRAIVAKSDYWDYIHDSWRISSMGRPRKISKRGL